MARSKKDNPDKQNADDDVIRIKKYPNRRLYNTSTSSHIVLDDLVDLVKSGKEFVVEDAKTGEDITRSILNQVIYEREANGSSHHFPLDVQKQLIAMYDDTYAQMVPDYLRESMNVFVSQRDKMNASFEEIFSANSKAMSDFNQNLARQNMEVFNRTFEFFQSMSGMPASSKNTESSPEKDDGERVEKSGSDDNKQDELAEIQTQINALQERLKQLK